MATESTETTETPPIPWTVVPPLPLILSVRNKTGWGKGKHNFPEW